MKEKKTKMISYRIQHEQYQLLEEIRDRELGPDSDLCTVNTYARRLTELAIKHLQSGGTLEGHLKSNPDLK